MCILQLPPPPQIELVVDKPHLMNVLRRPLVRIRRRWHKIKLYSFSYINSLQIFTFPAATSSEVKQRKQMVHKKNGLSTLATHRALYTQNPLVKSDAAVAILSKKPDSKASLACVLPWGHGWGWATLPNGVWSGGKNKNTKLL